MWCKSSLRASGSVEGIIYLSSDLLSIYRTIELSIYQSIYLSIYFKATIGCPKMGMTVCYFFRGGSFRLCLKTLKKVLGSFVTDQSNQGIPQYCNNRWNYSQPPRRKKWCPIPPVVQWGMPHIIYWDVRTYSGLFRIASLDHWRIYNGAKTQGYCGPPSFPKLRPLVKSTGKYTKSYLAGVITQLELWRIRRSIWRSI